jgi:hypothetical protein
MTVTIILVILTIALFIGAFWSRRRFGLLGLALTAGSTLSSIWSYDAGLVVSSTGLVPNGPLTNAVTLCLIVLLPAIVLLFHGSTYKSPVARGVGAALFAILALAFLIQPLGFALTLDGTAKEVYDTVVKWRDVIISVGVVLAIGDLFLTKPKLLERDRKR